jgi:hypothetical protein
MRRPHLQQEAQRRLLLHGGALPEMMTRTACLLSAHWQVSCFGELRRIVQVLPHRPRLRQPRLPLARKAAHLRSCSLPRRMWVRQ